MTKTALQFLKTIRETLKENGNHMWQEFAVILATPNDQGQGYYPEVETGPKRYRIHYETIAGDTGSILIVIHQDSTDESVRQDVINALEEQKGLTTSP